MLVGSKREGQGSLITSPYENHIPHGSKSIVNLRYKSHRDTGVGKPTRQSNSHDRQVYDDYNNEEEDDQDSLRLTLEDYD